MRADAIFTRLIYSRLALSLACVRAYTRSDVFFIHEFDAFVLSVMDYFFTEDGLSSGEGFIYAEI